MYDKYHLSYSSLGAFDSGPKAFLNYRERRDEDDGTDSTRLGSKIHCLVLEPDQFEHRYIITTNDPVTGKMGEFIESYVATDNFDLAYEQAGFKWSKELVQTKLQEPANAAYLAYLKDKGEKEAIGPSEKAVVDHAIFKLQEHKLARRLLFDDPGKRSIYWEVYNEKELEWLYPGYKFRFKGVIDRLLINHELKQVYIVDLKTTSRNIYNFGSSYFKYRYYWQLYLYRIAVKYMLWKMGKDYKNYTFNLHIVAVQTVAPFVVRVFAPAEADMQVARTEIEERMDKLKFHFEQNVWENSAEYYLGDGCEKIQLKYDTGKDN